MDSEQLAEALDFLQEHRGEYHIESLLIIRHGYVVADVYFYPYAPDTMHDLTSATKSFTSSLIGIAIDKGYIEGVEQPILDIFSKRTVTNVDADKRAMTVEDLLTHRSGLEVISAGEVTQNEMMETPDWVQFTLDLPMSDEPGERYVYSNPCVHLLSASIRETTGLSLLDFAQQHLFGPLGISDVAWPSDPQGNNRGWGDLYLTPHDMAKLGYLYLHKGLWDDEQVLSASWVDAATSIPKSVNLKTGDFAYGYLWWLNPDYYKADGRDGQKIYVIPEKDMVVVHTGAGGTKIDETAFPLEDFDLEERVVAITPWSEKELLIPYIIQAAESETPLPANHTGVALLESKIQQAAAQPEAKPMPPLPDTALTVSGKTYAMDENRLGITSLSLTFQDEKEALFRMAAGEIQQEVQVGLEDVYRFSQLISFRNLVPVRVAAKGAWESDNTFVIDSDELGNILRMRLRLTFEGNEVALKIEAPLVGVSLTLNGKQIEG
jgi:CubicO group peptidase (beta-lactamase class C family)